MDEAPDRPLGPAEEAERKRRQRARSIAIALVLAGLVGLFYIITIIQMSSNTPGPAS